MKTSEKQFIANKLAEYCEIKGSQNKAAATLDGVSSATISQIINGNWSLISDEMWRNISVQIGCTSTGIVVKTRGYDKVYKTMKDGQENAMVFGIIGNEGSGKTETIESYGSINRNVFHLKCAVYWNRRFFVSELCRLIGINPSSSSVPGMMRDIVSDLKKMQSPQIVIDEADKLSDPLLYFFISLYNDLEDYCSIIVAGTPYLEARIKKGVERNTKGFREIFSRLGRKFIYVPLPDEEDIIKVCKANGIANFETINKIIEDSDNDLRRVHRKIHAEKKRLKID